MDEKEYLKKLQDLKKFLKEHPEQYKVYRDIHIDSLILETKHRIFSKEGNINAQDRLLPDGFAETVFNPFL